MDGVITDIRCVLATGLFVAFMQLVLISNISIWKIYFNYFITNVFMIISR